MTREKKLIPVPLIALVADLVDMRETHATLNSLFMYAEATGDAPAGSKVAKAQAWLRATNKEHTEPLEVLAKIICQYMEAPEAATDYKYLGFGDEPDWSVNLRELVRKIEATLAKNSLVYHLGGTITDGGMAPSKSLKELIHGRDIPALHREFDRALESVESKPRDAVSAAANILESVFKVYIEDNGLAMPDKQDLQPVFKVVRSDLGLDPGKVEDQDLQRIISGLFSVVDGIGALRTHASSAHSEGRNGYRLEPRHARLAVNAAHSVATFILEAWNRRLAQQPKL